MKNYVKNLLNKEIIWLILLTILLTVYLKKGLFFEELATFLGSSFLIYFSFLFYFWLMLVTTIGVGIIKIILEKTHYLLYKNSRKSKENLYEWLGHDTVSEVFLMKFLNKNASEKHNVIENIKDIKDLLEKELEGKLVNYNLLKNYLEFKQKNNSFTRLRWLLLSIMGTITTFIVSSVIKPNIIEYYNQNLELDFAKIFTNETYSNVIIFLGVGFSVYLFIGGIMSAFSEPSRRIKYLISILEILIKDKESIGK